MSKELIIAVSFWKDNNRFTFMFDMYEIRLDEVLTCIQKQFTENA